MPSFSPVTLLMLASKCFQIKDGEFQLSPSWGSNGARVRDQEQQTDWDRVCSCSEMALLMWVNRLDTQFCQAGGIRWVSRKRGGGVTAAAQQCDPNVTFRSACIARAALTYILEPAYRVMGELCLSYIPECSAYRVMGECAGCHAYKSCLHEWEMGEHDVELAGWCESETMLLQNLSFVESRLQAVYQQFGVQLEVEQKAFKKLVEEAEGDIEAIREESGTFRLCRPCKKDSQWVLQIALKVDRLWGSIEAFRQPWEQRRIHHEVTLELNPSRCLALVPDPPGQCQWAL